MANENSATALGLWLARTMGHAGALVADLDTDSLGVRMPDVLTVDPAVEAAAAALASAAESLARAVDALDDAIGNDDEGDLISALAGLLEALVELVDTIRQFVATLDAATGSIVDPIERQEIRDFLPTLARAIIDHLVVSVLELERPRLLFLFKLTGLVDWTVVEADPAVATSRRHIRKALRLDRIQSLLEDPVGHFGDVLGWGTAAFDPLELFQTFGGFYFEETAVDIGEDLGDAFFLKPPFRWSRDSSTSPPGLRLDIDVAFDENLSGEIGLGENWTAILDGGLTASGGLTARATPPFDVEVEPPSGQIGGEVSFSVERAIDARPFTIVGGNDLIHLKADNVAVGAELEVGADTSGAVSVEPFLLADIAGLVLTIGSDDADSFLASLLAGLDIEGRFDLGLEWRGSEGLVIRAAGGLEMAIPMHQNLGIAELQTLFVVAGLGDDGTASLELSAAVTGLLGPISASVERVGATFDLAFVDSADARYGPIDLALRFKPPDGVGLSLDVEVVKGGGYLYIDVDNGEYAGAIELVFSGFMALAAIGLISTRLPDGSDGFSLLVVITAEFATPLQLGLGFTLNAVGGLVGLNRTVDLEEMATGVRDGSIESVMFPTDVIANAPQIISDMRRFFPTQEDTFLIGLMAKLGWGTPTLVTASLGVIIEIPPGNIAVLGVLKVALPDEDAGLLVLQVNFIGAYEVDKSRIWFFASLFESRVLFITISGEMGLLIAWGDAPEFVISIGGFHPTFTPPPLPFPTPDRVSVSILNESFARVLLQGYFAVTSNTAQVGASAELFFGLSEFNIDGHVGFDALFQFSPFYFTISFSAELSVKVFGIGLYSVRMRGELEGTSPWYIEGEGSISLLFFDIDVPFSHSWGSDADTMLPSIAALPLLTEELTKPSNWLAVPPEGNHLSVALRQLDESDGVVLHPVGELTISQQAMPLDLHLDKIGNQAINDIERAGVSIDDPDLDKRSDAERPFATAQYQELADSARLSTPAFESQHAGLVVGGADSDIETSRAVKRIVLHELITIDSNYLEHRRSFYNIGLLPFTNFLGLNATARSSFSAATARSLDPFESRVEVGGTSYVVANQMDNTVFDGDATFTSKAQADDYLRQLTTRDPGLYDNVHVILATEAVGAS